MILATLIWLPLGRSNGQPREFTIQPGDGSSKVARLLAEAGLVRSRYLFLFYTFLAGHEKDFQAGRYLISRQKNIPNLVGMFSRGEAESDDLTVTIPEGSNVFDLVKILKQAGVSDVDTLSFFADEGYLFPDTYRFPREIAAPEIEKKMKGNFTNKTGNKFSKEQVIIASILEKEVRKAEDMALVAGIIEKRLIKGMPLQIDATVAYGACREEEIKNRGCDVSQVNLFKWLKIDTPYNTYLRSGLPPTPIANPGEQALIVAEHPRTSDYWYYLSAKDGATIFSKTLAEHERNRKKYLGL